MVKITKDEKDFRKILDEIFVNMATDERCFSNEAQLQYELALRLRDYEIVKDVELEVLSSNLTVNDFQEMNNVQIEKDKFYTDIVVDLGGNQYVAIELKFKTPEYDEKIKQHQTKSGKVFYTFAQGAEDEGSVLFWRDVERLEKFGNQKDGILLNFDENKKVVKKFAILMTNANKYWTRDGYRFSLCENFFPVEYVDEKTKTQKVFKGDLCWKIKVCKINGVERRVSGKTSTKNTDVIIKDLTAKEHSAYSDYYDLDGKQLNSKEIKPIYLKGFYICNWNDYITLVDGTKFRYLILEVNNHSLK